jgi:hypothetical protein
MNLREENMDWQKRSGNRCNYLVMMTVLGSAARATNGGSIDALTLATAIAEGDQINANAIIATNERTGY